MFKIKKQLLVVILALPVVAFAAIVQHDNEFCIRSKYKDKESLTFKIVDPNLLFYNENYRITDGQPWGGVENKYNSCVIIKAGRKKKDYVRIWADKKNQELNGVKWSGDNMIASQSPSKTPDRLNFAFIADIEISRVPANNIYGNPLKYVCPNVIMAQGSYSKGISGNINNWWLFSNIGGKSLRCIGSNGSYYTFALVYPDAKEQYDNVIYVAFSK